MLMLNFSRIISDFLHKNNVAMIDIIETVNLDNNCIVKASENYAADFLDAYVGAANIVDLFDNFDNYDDNTEQFMPDVLSTLSDVCYHSSKILQFFNYVISTVKPVTNSLSQINDMLITNTTNIALSWDIDIPIEDKVHYINCIYYNSKKYTLLLMSAEKDLNHEIICQIAINIADITKVFFSIKNLNP